MCNTLFVVCVCNRACVCVLCVCVCNRACVTFCCSIVMTTCSTLLALGMMPLLLFLYCQGISGLENAVPYTGITLSLVLTLLPCAIGVYINHRVPQYSKLITKVR